MKNQHFSNYFGFTVVLTSLLLVACDKNNVPNGDPQEDSLLRVAEKFQNSGDLGASLSFYKQILEKEPEQKEALLGAATISWKMGEYGQTHQYLDKLLVLEPSSFPARRLRAKTFLAQEKGPEALTLFQVLSKENPQDASLLNLQGVCYDLKSDHEKARTFYEKALFIEPNNIGIKSNLGLSLTLSGKYDEAKKILEEIKDTAGITSRERHNLAIAYGMSGDLERAEHIFRIDLDAATTRKNIERLAAMSGAAPAALPFVDASVPLALEASLTKSDNKLPSKPAHKPITKPSVQMPEKPITPSSQANKSLKQEAVSSAAKTEDASFIDAPSQEPLNIQEETSSVEEVTPVTYQENSLTSESILDR